MCPFLRSPVLPGAILGDPDGFFSCQNRPGITAVWTIVDNFREGQVPSRQISTTSVWTKSDKDFLDQALPTIGRGGGMTNQHVGLEREASSHLG